MHVKNFLALFTALAVTISHGAFLAFSLFDAEPEQPEEIVAEEFATSGATGQEVVSEEEQVDEPEEEPQEEPEVDRTELGLTFGIKDPYDLEGNQRISTYAQRAYNASGFTGEGSYLYGDQLPSDSAARMVYDALKDAWLGVNPADVERQLTIEFGEKKIPMRTTVSGIYDNSGYWDRQSASNVELVTQCAFDTFLYDFADIFWLKLGSGGTWYSADYQPAGDGTNFHIVSITINVEFIDNASSYYTAVDNKIGILSDQFTNNGTAGDPVKIRNAHDYITTHIEYGYTSMFGEPHIRTPYGTLFGDKIVCEGYARTFKLFCDRFNIPCVLVMGYAEPQHILHMWNAVKLDGKWYIVDATWDDLGGNRVAYTYFLAGLDTVVSSQPGYTTPRRNHIPEGVINSSAFVFSYPSINSTAYFASNASTPPSGLSGPSYVGGGSGGGSGGGGGGGSSGSASGGTITGIVRARTMDVTLNDAYTAVRDAINVAKTSGNGTANVRFRNPGRLTLDVIRKIVETAGMPVKITADSMSADGKSVDIRISLDPSGVTSDLDLSASISDEQALKMNANFTKWFKNMIQSVSLAQKKSFGQNVDFLVKLDSGMDKANLKFYRYDGESYSLLPNQKYYVTGNGYVGFSADPAGNIIISSGSLVKN